MYLYSKKRKILDVTAGGTSFAVLGWSQKKIIEAINKQNRKFCHIDYKIWEDENINKLSKLLLSQAEHKLDAVYYPGNSGSDACEAAMKLSFQTHQAQGNKKKKWFIGRDQSYHGINSDSLSIADRPNLNIYKSFFSKFRTRVSQNFYLRERQNGEKEIEYTKRCVQELEKKILKIGPENICAFVGETIMGGLVGDVEPSKDYWKLIRKLCTKYNIHLILDECYCGLGSSGKIYCCDWDKVTPDFIFVAKNLAAGYAPINAVITRKKYTNQILNKFGRIQHSSTYQAHSSSIAAAYATQKIIHTKKILKNVFDQGNYMRRVLKDTLSGHDFYFDVRGRGLRFSIEFQCKNVNLFTTSLARQMLDRHNIFISGKFHRVCFTPAFIITKKQADYILENFFKEFFILASNWK